jgi:hypothetical protein
MYEEDQIQNRILIVTACTPHCSNIVYHRLLLRIKNNFPRPELQLSQCFMMAAEDLLEPEVFRQIEEKAMRILEA